MSKMSLLTLLAGLAGFAQPLDAASLPAKTNSPATEARAESPFLTQQAAAERAARVSKVAYELDFTLTGEPEFTGTTRVDFELADNRSPLTLDLDDAKINALVVNGTPVKPQYNKWFITLSAADLVVGRNSVIVSYQRKHSTSGEGLHRYKDATDGKVYLYSHFEPAAAHQMFALFDQPDLKATFRMTVSAPKDWQVISTRRESGIEDRGTMRRWTFPATPVLSPYNFSLHAGPYRVWEDNSGKYPMRLFARQSVASQVSPKDWFRYTSQGLEYFDRYFGIPYPFAKYDQVLVPQFIYGAMENAAAITFTEGRFISPSAMTTSDRENLSSTILHEMAHQWFGDLVTMVWWNGLWLNESFASYMEKLASDESDEFGDPRLAMYRGKRGAYRLDQSITTHPVEVPVASTANAFDNIDSITYSKGAAVLHQLRQSIGAETFRQGVHEYLTQYSYGNATLDDFIGALSKASGRDLKPWAREWLYEPGVNTLRADFACTDGKLSRFKLLQSPANAAFPVLRTQMVQVGLFGLSGGNLTLNRKADVTYTGESTDVPSLLGQACPDLVYPNYQDWGYAQVVLDPKSFATAGAHLASVDDVLLRSMLWQAQYDGLRDGRLGLEAFIETLLLNTPLEADYTLLGQALEHLSTAKGYLQNFAKGTGYDQRTTERMERMLWLGLQASRADNDRARRWLATYIDVASSEAALANITGMLAGRIDAAGVEIDQSLRWDIIERLNRLGATGSEALLTAEIARDKSESGQLSALRSTVVRPDAAIKLKWLATIQALDGAEPYSRLRTAMSSLYPSGQEALNELTAEQRLRTLPAFDQKGDRLFIRSYAGSMIPATCNAASVARLEAAAKAMTALSAGTRRALLSRLEEDRRCVAIRNKFEAGLPKVN